MLEEANVQKKRLPEKSLDAFTAKFMRNAQSPQGIFIQQKIALLSLQCLCVLCGTIPFSKSLLEEQPQSHIRVVIRSKTKTPFLHPNT
jgi:hypothetical protein